MPFYSKKSNISDENPYGLSIGDLMAGLLLIIILVLFSVMLKLESFFEERSGQLKTLEEHQEIKRKIISRLISDLSKYDVEIDVKTGVVMIKEGVLFDFGQSYIKKSGEQFLNKFVSGYINVLLSDDDVSSQIAMVIIEGHTDNIGSYESNMELSLNRSRSVVNYIFSGKIKDLPHRDKLQKLLSANGRSFSDPRLDNESDDGRAANRRVEFKFRLVDWDVVFANKNNNDKKSEH